MKRKKIIPICLFVLVLLIIGSMLYARYIEPERLVVHQISVNSLNKENGCRVVFFSDTHFGSLYAQENVEKIVEKINAQNPDIVLFGGDFFDSYYEDKESLDLDYLSNYLDQISATYGKYAVYGNHDYGGGAVRVYKSFMEDGGFEVLVNETIRIEELDLSITAYDDFLMGSIDTSLYTTVNEGQSIIVSHAADIVDEIQMTDEHILMLSGHSHGGQVHIPFLVNKVLPPGALRYYKGIYKNRGINENITIYVTNGIGLTVLPYRFLSVPEILVVDLEY